MSAISLLWSTSRALAADHAHAQMLAALALYGPDGAVAEGDEHIALGVNVFSSLPENKFDRQPLWSPNRSCCLIADVRLDNRDDLARGLNLAHPEELADSAFLLHAWERWGVACLDHLIGGFAFAVWTPGKNEVFAARDHAGERPLFYHRSADFFALASMYKGLLALPISRDLRESKAADWIGCLAPDWSTTFYKEIDRLPPGHFLRVTPGSLSVTRYWSPARAKPIRFRKDAEYAEALLEIFDRATQARLRSTYPIGSMLSAGLDSSSVTASAARLLASEGKRLTSFTSVPRPDFAAAVPPGFFPMEAEGAAAVASLYPNIDHVLLDSRGYPLMETLRRWIDAVDEPIGAPVNLLWLTAMFDQAKQRDIRVVLEGTQGNVTFSYNTWTPLSDLLRRGRWIQLARLISAVCRRGALARSSAVRLTLQPFFPGWLRRMRVPKSSRECLRECLVNPALKKQYNLDERVFNTFHPAGRNAMEEHLALFEGFDHGAFRAGLEAANGIEVRDPTADKRLYEFSFAIPPEQFLAEGHNRSLARRAMKDRLPQSVLSNYMRGLQGADWHAIMSQALPELREELASMRHSPAAKETLDLNAIEALLDTWRQSSFDADDAYPGWHFWFRLSISMGYFLRTHDPAVACEAVK